MFIEWSELKSDTELTKKMGRGATSERAIAFCVLLKQI